MGKVDKLVLDKIVKIGTFHHCNMDLEVGVVQLVSRGPGLKMEVQQMLQMWFKFQLLIMVETDLRTDPDL